MKKLLFVLVAAFAMMACNGNSVTSECANDSISVDSTDTIVAVDSTCTCCADSLVADSI